MGDNGKGEVFLEQFDMCLGWSHQVQKYCYEKEDTVCKRKA